MSLDVPRSFENAEGAAVPIVVRNGLDETAAAAVLDLVAAPNWSGLSHAYGPAADTPAQLAAVTVGDGATRARAWSNLWGNVWHQGTIYEASAATVPVLCAIARWHDHPDRIRALVLLREFAAGEGSRKADVDAALGEHLPTLFPRWREEPETVRRALVWILGVAPELRREYHDLVDETLPKEHRAAWAMVVEDADPEGDEAYDAFCALEGWAADAGWPSEGDDAP